MLRKKWGVLFIGGDGPNTTRVTEICKNADLIAAADSGLDHAMQAGIVPAALIGDMDSYTAPIPEGIIIEHHPIDKDQTDTELGIDWLRKNGMQDIVLIGGGGGRMDHLFAIMALFWSPSPPRRWYTAQDELLLVRESMCIKAPYDQIVSIFAVPGNPVRVSSKGLKWSLDEIVLDYQQSSLSNRVSADLVEIKLYSGALLFIRNLSDDSSITSFDASIDEV